MGRRVMIMAAGTGGHVFPGLAVAAELKRRGHEVFWLGTPAGMENRLVPKHGIEMESIAMKGLRGNGIMRLLTAPIKLLRALMQALSIIRKRRPDVVIGMGGFVTGPGGMATRLMGLPLLIHEQNAVPGMANRLLAKMSNKVLEAFPGSFEQKVGAVAVGNPVRRDVTELEAPETRYKQRQGLPRLLIVGGSLGAQVLNETVAPALEKAGVAVDVRHQSGRGKLESTVSAYEMASVKADVSEFIDDMAEAYSWADLIVCRAGALTVSELAAAGVASILVPYLYAVDDHQTKNGGYLADSGAAVLMPQTTLDADKLAEQLRVLLSDRDKMMNMAIKARNLGISESDSVVADICEEVMAV